MKTFLRRLLRVLAGLFIAAVGTGLWLTGTTGGLRAIVFLADALGPGISARHLGGTLIEGAVLTGVDVRTQGQDVQIGRLEARCECALLLFGIVDLPEVAVEHVGITERSGSAPRQPEAPRAPSLPFFLRIGELSVERIMVDGRLQVQRLQADVSAGPHGITLRDASLDLPAARLGYSGILRIGRDWRVRLDGRWHASAGKLAALGAAHAEGDAARLTGEISMESPAPGRIAFTGLDLFAGRQWEASLSLPRGPLARLDARLPAAIEAGIEATAQGRGREWRAEGSVGLRQPEADPVQVVLAAHSLPDDPARFSASARWSDARWQAGDVALSDLTGELRVERTAGGLHATLRSRLLAADTPGEIEAEVIPEGDLVRIPVARLSLADGGALHASGEVRTGGAQPEVTLDAGWDGLPLTPGPLGPVVLRAGSARIEGSPENWSAEIRGRAEGERIPPAAAEAALRGNAGTAAIETLRVDLLGGQVSATGTLRWRPERAIDLSWDAAGLDPGSRWARWPGTLGGKGTVKWRSDGAAVKAALAGRLRGSDVRGDVGITLADGGLRIDEMALRSGTAELDVSGTAGDTLDLAFRLDAPQLAAVHPDAAGDLHGEGTVTGSRDAPVIHGTLRAAGVSAPWAGADELFVNVDLDAKGGGTVIGVAGSGLSAGKTRIERVRFDVDGTRARHGFRLEADAGTWRARLEGGGSTDKGTWEGSVRNMTVDSRRLGQWSLEAPLPLRYGDGAFSLGEGCLARDDSRLCPRLETKANREWMAALTLESMPVDLLSAFAPENVSVHGTWNLEAAAEGTAGTIRHAGGRLVTRDAGLELDIREREPYRVQVTEGSGRFELADGVLRSELGLDFDDPALRPFSAVLTLAPVQGWPVNPEEVRIEGRLAGGLRGLGFLAAASSVFEDVRGALSLDITVDGTLASPVPHGEFSLADGSFRLPEFGTAMHAVTLEGRDSAPGEMAFSGGMTSGTGRLDIRGQVSGLPDAPSARAGITGQRFEIVNLPEVWALVSPELEVQADAADGSVTAGGRVLVPEARINLDEVVVAPSLSEDVVVKGERKKASMTKAGRFDAEVEVVLGDKVEITGRGLKGRLAGSLRIEAPAGRKPLADGEIRIVDGSYSAYGQSLQIEEGRVVYTRAELDNPQLDVRAVRKVGDVTAGVAITGRLTNPRISLFSSPSMSQEQILAYVVLGRPLSQVGAGEGDTLVDAASTMGLQNSGFLTSSLASTFGLDTVSVETSGTAETASLVIGKYLSPRLYLSYGIGMFEAMSTARLRYDLTDSWALQAESSDEMGVDLFYKINTGVP